MMAGIKGLNLTEELVGAAATRGRSRSSLYLRLYHLYFMEGLRPLFMGKEGELSSKPSTREYVQIGAKMRKGGYIDCWVEGGNPKLFRYHRAPHCCRSPIVVHYLVQQDIITRAPHALLREVEEVAHRLRHEAEKGPVWLRIIPRELRVDRQWGEAVPTTYQPGCGFVIVLIKYEQDAADDEKTVYVLPVEWRANIKE